MEEVVLKLKDIPHIVKVPNDGRILIFQPWYDVEFGEWYSYGEYEKDKFVRLQIKGIISGAYLAVHPYSSQDLPFPLGELIAQHLSFPNVTAFMYQMISDIHLISASFEKLEILSEIVRSRGSTFIFLIESEVEQLFILARQMYDLLHKTIRAITDRIIDTGSGKKVMHRMRGSFSDIVKDDSLTRQNLMDKYRMPEPLASFYISQREIFNILREIRVAIEHNGKSVPSVFFTPKGMAI